MISPTVCTARTVRSERCPSSSLQVLPYKRALLAMRRAGGARSPRRCTSQTLHLAALDLSGAAPHKPYTWHDSPLSATTSPALRR